MSSVRIVALLTNAAGHQRGHREQVQDVVAVVGRRAPRSRRSSARCRRARAAARADHLHATRRRRTISAGSSVGDRDRGRCTAKLRSSDGTARSGAADPPRAAPAAASPAASCASRLIGVTAAAELMLRMMRAASSSTARADPRAGAYRPRTRCARQLGSRGGRACRRGGSARRGSRAPCRSARAARGSVRSSPSTLSFSFGLPDSSPM